MCDNILYCLVDVDCEQYFKLVDCSSVRTRGHSKKLSKPLCSTAFAGTFWHRIINVWNELPDDMYFYGTYCLYF